MKNSRRDLVWVASLSLALGVTGTLGCSKKERAVPPGPGGMPAMAGAGGNAASQVHAPEGGGMPLGHPPVLKGAAEVPTEAPGAAPAAGAAGEVSVRGTLKLDDKVKDKVQPGAVIFLMARAAPQGGPPAGPPLAVKKLTTGAWPQPFELLASDVMLQGSTLQGKVVITARIDQDGDAMTKSIGDVEAVTTPVDVPAAGIDVVFNKVRTEEAGAPSPPGMGGGMGGGSPFMGVGGKPPGHP